MELYAICSTRLFPDQFVLVSSGDLFFSCFSFWYSLEGCDFWKKLTTNEFDKQKNFAYKAFLVTYHMSLAGLWGFLFFNSKVLTSL